MIIWQKQEKENLTPFQQGDVISCAMKSGSRHIVVAISESNYVDLIAIPQGKWGNYEAQVRLKSFFESTELNTEEYPEWKLEVRPTKEQLHGFSERLEERWKACNSSKYDPVGNNCEHFAYYVSVGQNYSPQTDWLGNFKGLARVVLYTQWGLSS